MARRRFLVLYDIRDEGRLRRVHDVVRCFGYRFQYSVFLCDLNPSERIQLTWELEEVMDQIVDSVAIVDLGVASSLAPGTFTYLGRRLPPPPRGSTVL